MDLDPVICSSLSDIANGYVTVNPSNRSVGSVATYGCNNNHSLNGNKMRTCQQHGSWTGTEPLCGEYSISRLWIHITARYSLLPEES